MTPEQCIEKNIFEQMAIRGYGKQKCAAAAAAALEAWRKHDLNEGVGFPSLLANAIKMTGKPPVRSMRQEQLFLAVLNNAVTIRRRDTKSATWYADFRNTDNEIKTVRYMGGFIDRLQMSGFLASNDESETELLPAGDLSWINLNVKKVAVAL